MNTADRIKAARKSAGLTQKELGERMNISDASITQYESGKRNPKHKTLMRIADALGCTIDYLAGKTDDPHQHILEMEPIRLDPKNPNHLILIDTIRKRGLYELFNTYFYAPRPLGREQEKRLVDGFGTLLFFDKSLVDLVFVFMRLCEDDKQFVWQVIDNLLQKPIYSIEDGTTDGDDNKTK